MKKMENFGEQRQVLKQVIIQAGEKGIDKGFNTKTANPNCAHMKKKLLENPNGEIK